MGDTRAIPAISAETAARLRVAQESGYHMRWASRRSPIGSALLDMVDDGLIDGVLGRPTELGAAALARFEESH